MRAPSEYRERWLALLWLLIGIGMLAVAFAWRVPNQQYVQMLTEKVLLEKQHAPHDHLDPDKIEKFRPAWTNPIFIFGIGAIVLAGVQLALSSGAPRMTSDKRKT
jgi:hypothetical protein